MLASHKQYNYIRLLIQQRGIPYTTIMGDASTADRADESTLCIPNTLTIDDASDVIDVLLNETMSNEECQRKINQLSSGCSAEASGPTPFITRPKL